jgi:HD-like signal output (HDOD) protein
MSNAPPAPVKRPVAPTYRTEKSSTSVVGTSAPDEARGAALNFLAKLAGEVSGGTVDLPCFPDVVLKIRRALADPKTTQEKTVKIVGAEPRLTARLLQTANSAAFNQTGKPITDLRTAITRLGHQLVQSAAMGYAVQQMKEEPTLRSISKQLTTLWLESVAVASICMVIARRSKVTPDEAFLTGLLHGIGRLYIMVRSVGVAKELTDDLSFMDLVSGWHASIGKAILENWGFTEQMAEAVGEQNERDRKHRHEPDLTDVVVAAVALGEVLKMPEPRSIDPNEVASLVALRLTPEECLKVLKHAEYQLGSLQEALGR